MKLKIIFEDGQILVVDKQTGLVVNRSETIKEETLQDQLSTYLKLSAGDLGIGDRAGIVHRLDRETSGLLVVAKTLKSFQFLQNQFKEKKVTKIYLGLVHGIINNQVGTISLSVGRVGKFGKFGVIDARTSKGRESETSYEVIARYKFKEEKFLDLISNFSFSKSRINYLKNHAQNYTFLKFLPKTGRTHQIRVHAKSIGHPVVSDAIYTPSKLLKFDFVWCKRLFLHAQLLEFVHPKGKKPVRFESDLPNDLKSAMLNLSLLR